MLIACKIDELVILGLSITEFCFTSIGRHYDVSGIAFALVLTLLLTALGVLRICNSKPNESGFNLAYAIATTLLLLSCIGACTRLYDEAYAFSLIAMLLAFVNIAVGFMLRRGTLRIFGLVLVLFCVIKLLIVDLINLNSIMRVVAFIGCGLICFGISALYNFAVKRLKTPQLVVPQTTLQPQPVIPLASQAVAQPQPAAPLSTPSWPLEPERQQLEQQPKPKQQQQSPDPQQPPQQRPQQQQHHPE